MQVDVEAPMPAAAGANIVVCIFNQEEHSPGTRQDRHRSTPVSLCDHFRAHEARPVDEASFANREHKEDHAFWLLPFPGSSHPSPMPNRWKCWYISPTVYLGVSKNSGYPKSSIKIGFSLINPSIWGTGSLFLETSIYISGFFPAFHQQLIVNMLGIDDVIGKGYKSKSSGSVQREPQHTPGAYPMNPHTPKWKEFLHKLLVGGPGVCSRGILEKS